MNKHRNRRQLAAGCGVAIAAAAGMAFALSAASPLRDAFARIADIILPDASPVAVHESQRHRSSNWRSRRDEGTAEARPGGFSARALKAHLRRERPAASAAHKSLIFLQLGHSPYGFPGAGVSTIRPLPPEETLMRQVLVYDFPTRVFHWLFAGFFLTAFAIANLIDDDSARFSLHMLAGLGMVFVVVLRLIWSLVGTRHARLADLALKPGQLVAYFKGMFTADSPHWIGHNPASSWAAVAMVLLALGLGTTGYLMAVGTDSGTLEDAHELMANAFLAVVLLHIGGVAAHVLRHRDHLQASMITGRKPAHASNQGPVRSVPAAGLAFVVLTGLFSGYLLQHYDAQAHTLELFGSTMQLGEDEHGHDSDEDDGDQREREYPERSQARHDD